MGAIPGRGGIVRSVRSNTAQDDLGWGYIDGLVCGFGSRDLHAPPSTVLPQRQVHGVAIADANAYADRLARVEVGDYARVPMEVDALVAPAPGVIVGVRTADCVPLLMVAPDQGWAAAVHAGWRGTVAGIAAEAVRAAERAGVAAADLLVAVGPSIGPCCYEVSDQLGREFDKASLPVQWPDRGGKPHLDLRAANRTVLERSGVRPEAIQSVGPCTRCQSGVYHSFRAEPESPGRQVSWIGWEDRTRPAGLAPTR